ncbi:MAG: response regulator [Sphingobium sp.]|nr:response regulator [Sphingobium sp.]
MRHLLIVEDSALLAMDIELTAMDLGLQRVSAAADAGEALRLLETEKIDAALVDVFLGGEDSRLVTERLSALGIPFAPMTGIGDLEWLQAQLPGVPILTKPFTHDQLADILEQLC